MPAHKDPDSICLGIVTAVAKKEGVDPLELEPLYATLNTDALRNLLNGHSNQDLRVQFEYCDYTVTVDGGGHVDVN